MKKPVPKLETKHAIWLFETAAEGFVKKIEEMESEIARHHVAFDLGCEPTDCPPTARRVKATRGDRIEICKRWIAEYSKVLEVANFMAEVARNHVAEEFAADVAAFFGKK